MIICVIMLSESACMSLADKTAHGDFSHFTTRLRRRIPLLPTTLFPTIVLSSTIRTNVYVARLLTVLLVHGASIITEAVSHRLQHNPHSFLNPSRSYLTLPNVYPTLKHHRRILPSVASPITVTRTHVTHRTSSPLLLYALSFQVVLFLLVQSRNLISIVLPLKPTCSPVLKARRSSILWV
jgi:hypothetical protein